MIQQLDLKATRNGAIAALLLILAIYLGSGRMRHFDWALIAYAGASVFAAFGIIYRYSVWLAKPPTALYWRRGWEMFTRRGHRYRNVLELIRLLWSRIVLQTFIERRNHTRWLAHFFLSWGCILAALVTFPLVFGWIHFEPSLDNPSVYRVFMFGLPAGLFPSTSPIGWIVFHALDFAAIAVIAGMAFAFRRRMRDQGAMAVQQFGMDFLPLIMLFAVSVTGLALTASSLWMKGHSYSFLALLHAFFVIVTLIYLPFGKFFHIFQRPANLGVHFYKQAGDAGEPAACASCGEPFASRLHVADLKVVLDELSLDQRMEGGRHYQDVCPECRRKLIAVNQMDAIGGTGFL